jgi:XTP/dITP diphosphohydrolase
MTLVFATHNQNKAKEIQAIMPEGIEIVTLEDLKYLDEIPETGETLEENAIIKARFVHDKFQINCFADDTGLEIEALNNEPGVYSARYAGESKDANANMDLVLEKLKDKENRSAKFRTVIALFWKGELQVFEGIVKGKILESKQGLKGFGYDPIFEPENCGRSLAEMEMAEKNSMSHRARAFEKMVEFIKSHSEK